MNLRKLCNEKGFLYFATTLLTKSDLLVSSALYKFDVDDNELNKWFELYDSLINDKAKILKLEKKSSYYKSFILIYIFYLTQVDNNKIIIIQNNRDFSKELTSLIKNFLELDGVEGSKPIIDLLNRIEFSNKSTLNFLKLGTYNIKNLDNIDFIYFGEGKVINTEKLIFDLNEIDFLGAKKVKKTILSIDNDLNLNYIKKIK